MKFFKAIIGFVKVIILNVVGLGCLLFGYFGIEILLKLFLFYLLPGPERWNETRDFKDISWGEAIFEVPIKDIGLYSGDSLTFIAWVGLGAAYFGIAWICYRILKPTLDNDD